MSVVVHFPADKIKGGILPTCLDLLQHLAKILGKDVSAFNQLINNELKEVENDDEYYQVINVTQAQNIIVLLDDLLKTGDAIYEAKTYFLHPQYETIAQTKAGFWLEQLTGSDGSVRIGISRLIFSLQSIRYFLSKAVEMVFSVEAGRYELGFIDRQRLSSF